MQEACDPTMVLPPLEEIIQLIKDKAMHENDLTLVVFILIFYE